MTYSFNTKEELIDFINEDKKDYQAMASDLKTKINTLRQENNTLKVNLLKKNIKYYQDIHTILMNLNYYLCIMDMVKDQEIAYKIMETILSITQGLMEAP
jgi:hypothetical protein